MLDSPDNRGDKKDSDLVSSEDIIMKGHECDDTVDNNADVAQVQEKGPSEPNDDTIMGNDASTEGGGTFDRYTIDIIMVEGTRVARGGPFDRYTIQKILGKGAMGVVYLATDTVLERDVAIKQLHANLVHDKYLMDRFRSEAKVLAKMAHPGVVQIFDFIEEGGTVWIVMEFVRGRELSSYLKEKGALAVDEAASLGIQLAKALAYTHSLEIVHRDFKPENVLLTDSGILKIMDFGLAKSVQSNDATLSGTIMGTPTYMSPEQALGNSADSRSDIYSLGVVLYRVVTGRVPFEGELASVLAQHINKIPTPLREVEPSIPASFESLVSSMLEKDPEKRVQDMDTVAARLHVIESGKAGVEEQDMAKSDDEMEAFLEKRQKYDEEFKEKFKKVLTVMFTDLKGSTALAEKEGDLSSRILIMDHTKIVSKNIKENNGVLVKTMGDGTMSYFNTAQDALRAAVTIQRDMETYNQEKQFKTPVLIRIGLHTGEVILERNDIFGDIVNTASRFESSANPGEIYLSEDTFNALGDKGEIFCRYVKSEMFKGKSEPFNIYKAFWDKTEIERALPVEKGARRAAKSSRAILVGLFIAAIAIILAAVFIYPKLSEKQADGERRSISHSVTQPESPSR